MIVKLILNVHQNLITNAKMEYVAALRKHFINPKLKDAVEFYLI